MATRGTKKSSAGKAYGHPSPKKRNCVKYKLLGDCDYGEKCGFRHHFRARPTYTDYVQFPERVPIGLAVGRRAANLRHIMSIAECVMIPSERSNREVKVVTGDLQSLEVVVEKLRVLFLQIYPMAPTWCYFHTGGITEILGNAALEFRECKGRKPARVSDFRDTETPMYEVCLCQGGGAQHDQDTSLEDLEKFNPSTSPLETVDSLHSALDTLYVPAAKKKLSASEMAKASAPTTRARFMIDYRTHIQEKLQEGLEWMLKPENHQPFCTAKLEARFGKLLWFHLPDDVLVHKEPWGVNTFAEFVFCDTNHSQLFNTNVRVPSADVLCKELETAADSNSVVETLDVKFTMVETKTGKIDLRVKIGSDGQPSIVAVRKNERKVATFDLLCLHRQHDVRLSLSQMEVMPPTDALYPLVQRLFKTITFTDPTVSTVTLVPCTEEWTVSFIRRKKRTTYVLDGKYMVTVSHIREYKPNWENLDKGEVTSVEPSYGKEHTEVEFHNIKWEVTFGKDAGLSPEKSLLLHMDRPKVDPALLSSIAYPWDADTIAKDLEEMFEQLDILNESLGEA